FNDYFNLEEKESKDYFNLDEFLTYDKFLREIEIERNKKNYQCVIFDPSMCDNQDVYEISSFLRSRWKDVQRVILTKRPDIIERRDTLRRGILEDIIMKKEDIYFDVQDLSNALHYLKIQKKFHVSYPIAVIGGGTLGAEIVFATFILGASVHWYSNSLSRKEYNKGNKKIGYEELMRLSSIPISERILCYEHKDIEESEENHPLRRLLRSNPGIIIFATSLPTYEIFQTSGEDIIHERDYYDEKLLNCALPKFIDLLNKMKKEESKASLLIASNPPEALAYYAVLQGIPKNKILTLSPEKIRFLTRFANLEGKTGEIEEGKYSNMILLGTHSNPIFSSWLLEPDNNLPDRKIERNFLKRMEDYYSKVIKDMGNETLTAFRKFKETGVFYPFRDAAIAAREACYNLERFNSPFAGYYHSDFNAFLLGLPNVDYSDLSFHPPKEKQKQKRYMSAVSDHKEKLEELARKQRELAETALERFKDQIIK
ncbi:hypothetical protein HYW75_00935, partial [Candidatus Pacearchaeota archaeon]|nr:hypothetical protein [Candidatus Pacearchaeota archaeon]